MRRSNRLLFTLGSRSMCDFGHAPLDRWRQRPPLRAAVIPAAIGAAGSSGKSGRRRGMNGSGRAGVTGVRLSATSGRTTIAAAVRGSPRSALRGLWRARERRRVAARPRPRGQRRRWSSTTLAERDAGEDRSRRPVRSPRRAARGVDWLRVGSRGEVDRRVGASGRPCVAGGVAGWSRGGRGSRAGGRAPWRLLRRRPPARRAGRARPVRRAARPRRSRHGRPAR